MHMAEHVQTHAVPNRQLAHSMDAVQSVPDTPFQALRVSVDAKIYFRQLDELGGGFTQLLAEAQPYPRYAISDYQKLVELAAAAYFGPKVTITVTPCNYYGRAKPSIKKLSEASRRSIAEAMLITEQKTLRRPDRSHLQTLLALAEDCPQFKAYLKQVATSPEYIQMEMDGCAMTGMISDGGRREAGPDRQGAHEQMEHVNH